MSEIFRALIKCDCGNKHLTTAQKRETFKMSELFRALIKCDCGYEHLTVQTSENMTIWAGKKLLKIHKTECKQKSQLILGKDERKENKPTQ